tara:strand:- start:355 stop:543 length:189 start_codon:yes stop_codon:yes gene_type:complete
MATLAGKILPKYGAQVTGEDGGLIGNGGDKRQELSMFFGTRSARRQMGLEPLLFRWFEGLIE